MDKDPSRKDENGSSRGITLVPNETLYVHNLNDKVKKPELQRCLYMLFAQYGRVEQIVIVKSAKMRGQAHIVFSDINSAEKALKELDGRMFLEKPLAIEYARTKSRKIVLEQIQSKLLSQQGQDDTSGYDEDDMDIPRYEQ